MAGIASAICVVLCELIDFLLAFCNAVVIALSIATAIVIATLQFVNVDSLLQIDASLLDYLKTKQQQSTVASSLLVLSIIGIVIYPAITSSAGYSARKRRSPRLMTVHFALLSLPWIGLIALQVMIVSRTSVMRASLQVMQERLNEEFQDLWVDNRTSNENFMSVTWNAWMIKYDCCAMNDWNDFNQTKWASERSNSYVKFHANDSSKVLIPIACCKISKMISARVIEITDADLSCQLNPENSEITNGLRGCKPYLEALLNRIFSFFQSLLNTAIAATTILWVASFVVVVYYWRKLKAKNDQSNSENSRFSQVIESSAEM